MEVGIKEMHIDRLGKGQDLRLGSELGLGGVDERSVEREGEGKGTTRAWISMRSARGNAFYDLTYMYCTVYRYKRTRSIRRQLKASTLAATNNESC